VIPECVSRLLRQAFEIYYWLSAKCPEYFTQFRVKRATSLKTFEYEIRNAVSVERLMRQATRQHRNNRQERTGRELLDPACGYRDDHSWWFRASSLLTMRNAVSKGSVEATCGFWKFNYLAGAQALSASRDPVDIVQEIAIRSAGLY
jgi:hypothetical protein